MEVPVKNVKVPEKVKCLRCGHEWQPRKAEVRVCPHCRSPYWDRPKRAEREL